VPNVSWDGDHTTQADWRIVDATGHAEFWKSDAAVAVEATAAVDDLMANLTEV